MVTRRRGASTIGCLFSILVVALIGYYGVNLGQVWWRYWELVDRMKSAARFSVTVSAPETLRRLQADVEEIGLPAEAKKFKIQRSTAPPSVTISTEYHEKVELPFLHRTLTFKPTVTQRL
jgi:hypothetical protein